MTATYPAAYVATFCKPETSRPAAPDGPLTSHSTIGPTQSEHRSVRISTQYRAQHSLSTSVVVEDLLSAVR
jgi:hypothetical protein